MADKDTTTETHAAILQAHVLKKAGDIAGALRVLLPHTDPSRTVREALRDVLREVASLYMLMRKPMEAAVCFSKAIDAGDTTRLTLFNYGVALMESGQLDTALKITRWFLGHQGNDFSFITLHGVILKRQGLFKEAIAEFEKAAAIEPENPAPWMNMGNTYMSLHEDLVAADMYREAAKRKPDEHECIRLIGRALQSAGQYIEATAYFQQAMALKPLFSNAIADYARNLALLEKVEDGVAVLDSALVEAPNDVLLLEAKGWILKKDGQMDAARSVYETLTRTSPANVEGWVGLGHTFDGTDREKANACYRRAADVDGRSLRTLWLLSDSLNNSRYGREGDHIQEAYTIACEMVEKYPTHLMECSEDLKAILLRCIDYDRFAKLGDVKESRDYWLRKERIAAFHYELSRTKTMDDRLEMVRYHREWGEKVDAKAAITPIKHPIPIKHDKIRVGFMSSDLRAHPVAYFALPLFEYYDKSKFEVFCYSFYTREADHLQKRITGLADHFRWWPNKSNFDIAQGIADDRLDIIFELGGTTVMNRLQVMAYRPAPVQVSWLGYPHSSGLGSIDYIVVDPYLKPSDERLLIEKPFELPETWVSLGDAGFRDYPINPVIPEDRKGHITFGTMNNPYKYTRELIATWAAIMNRVPHSRFMFVRPEGDVPAFRANMESEFLKHGIIAERIQYVAVRSKHMPFYNEIDIALDSFPHVGGTTTCETLWMGVPVVTLVGPAFYERLSYTNLNNAGLGDLCAFTQGEYMEKALALVADKPRRIHLRLNLRSQLGQNPLGQPERFARNFYKKVEEVLK